MRQYSLQINTCTTGMVHFEICKISWPLSVMMGVILAVLDLPSTDAFPQPCRFPRQYEGRRFQSSYFAVKEEYVAVDCDRKLMYTRNGGKGENSYNIVDMDKSVMYVFNPGRECAMTPLRQFEIVDYCQTSKSASFTGSVTLDGTVRDGWVTTNSQRFEETTVVIRSKKSGEGCLPFVFRVRSDRHVLMASTLYDVKSGISDNDAIDRFDVDVTKCLFT